MTEKVLEVKDLKISFNTFAGKVQAVRGVNFTLKKGETLAIVGESGSGKSVTVRSIMQLLANNTNYEQGEIVFYEEDLLQKSDKEMRKIRGQSIAMIFQDPMTSLNPVMKIGDQIAEPIRLHQNKSKKEAYEMAIELLKKVGINEAKKRMGQYPFQFSGGQRQRIVIAIALACQPSILIADEPSTALDVTIQAQILELFKKIQKESETSIIFITHDLGVVANVADRVAVMYAGKIVEIGSVLDIFYNPRHPYTWGLISSMPSTTTKGKLNTIPGSPPDLLDPPVGDAFAVRSDYALAIDFEEEPPMFQVSEHHYAATWLEHPNAPEVNPPMVIQERYKIFRDLQKEVQPKINALEIKASSQNQQLTFEDTNESTEASKKIGDSHEKYK
jgi:oligopeptide transport system ATP-binding protein